MLEKKVLEIEDAKCEKKVWFLKPPTEWEIISFHMYAIKLVQLKLAWVATLHLRHIALWWSPLIVSFSPTQSDRYQTWGYCVQIMAAEYVWSNMQRGARQSSGRALQTRGSLESNKKPEEA